MVKRKQKKKEKQNAVQSNKILYQIYTGITMQMYENSSMPGLSTKVSTSTSLRRHINKLEYTFDCLCKRWYNYSRTNNVFDRK